MMTVVGMCTESHIYIYFCLQCQNPGHSIHKLVYSQNCGVSQTQLSHHIFANSGSTCTSNIIHSILLVVSIATFCPDSQNHPHLISISIMYIVCRLCTYKYPHKHKHTVHRPFMPSGNHSLKADGCHCQIPFSVCLPSHTLCRW